MKITSTKTIPPLHSSAGRLLLEAGISQLPIRQPSHMSRESSPMAQQVAACTGSTQGRIYSDPWKTFVTDLKG
jgi:hypothetical protein